VKISRENDFSYAGYTVLSLPQSCEDAAWAPDRTRRSRADESYRATHVL
jgi:hypothetical protein